MGSVFTQIVNGDLPGRVIWKDEFCFALLTHRPIRPGHTLIVPRQEIDHWLDLDPALTARLFEVARSVGRGIQHAFQPTKVGMMIAGLEVRHTHLHLIPIDSLTDLDFARQDPHAAAEDLDQAADHLRASLRTLGYAEVCS
jgi:diadenosine tetraphosphate (Ap4A) HIT family hydrolase